MGALLGGGTLADARLVEPGWFKVKHLRLCDGPPVMRLVHFSDLHHKGDAALLREVVAAINRLAPDFVCFTGDLVEEKEFLPEALGILSGIAAPMYGVPGNHDYWSKVDFEPIRQVFQATGGQWLVDQSVATPGGTLQISGMARLDHYHPFPKPLAGKRNLLLMHYPAWAGWEGTDRFDLMLAGHSHGGQVRIPFFGAPVLPDRVGKYELGLYQTARGPLYVNAGIGYLYEYKVRFNCRPEVTLIEL